MQTTALSLRLSTGLTAALCLASPIFCSALAHGEVIKDYPEVVSLYSTVSFNGRTEMAGRCTGTFIHPRLLLTAAHCVRQFRVERYNGQIVRATDMEGHPAPDITATPKDVYILQKKWWGTKKLRPIKVHVSDAALPAHSANFNLQAVEQDLAILEFDRDFPVVRSVAERTPEVGTPVLMMGFGRHGAMPAMGAGLGIALPYKQGGRNTVAMTEFDMIAILGANDVCEKPDKSPLDWSICSGDSGGPLIDSRTGEVLGVASTSGSLKTGRHISVFTDLTSAQARNFIFEVTRQLPLSPVSVPAQ